MKRVSSRGTQRVPLRTKMLLNQKACLCGRDLWQETSGCNPWPCRRLSSVLLSLAENGGRGGSIWSWKRTHWIKCIWMIKYPFYRKTKLSERWTWLKDGLSLSACFNETSKCCWPSWELRLGPTMNITNLNGCVSHAHLLPVAWDQVLSDLFSQECKSGHSPPGFLS